MSIGRSRLLVRPSDLGWPVADSYGFYTLLS